MIAEPPQKSLLILPGSAEFMAFDAPPVSDVVVPASDDQVTTATHHDVIYPAGAVNCAVEITAASALTAGDVDPERPQQADLAGDPIDGPQPEETAMAPFSAADYSRLRGQHGPPRAVLCQPAEHGFDHHCLLAALETLQTADAFTGQHLTAAVAIVASDVSDHEMEDLTAAGCCAGRFHMEPQPSQLDWSDLDRLAWRIHDFNWHVELRMDGRYLHAVEARLRDWPGPIVIENFGHFLKPVGQKDDGFRALLRLIDRDKAWVKLADPAALSVAGPPHYEDLAARARDLIAFAPERMLWGDNVAATPGQHFSAAAYAAFQDWCDSSAQLHAIMVSNAEAIYRFEPWTMPPDNDSLGA